MKSGFRTGMTYRLSSARTVNATCGLSGRWESKDEVGFPEGKSERKKGESSNRPREKGPGFL